MFEIQDHELVPKHEALSASECKEVLEKFNVTKGQMPRINVSDPAIEKLDAKPGDIIRITRKSPTAGESVYYRTVIKG